MVDRNHPKMTMHEWVHVLNNIDFNKSLKNISLFFLLQMTVAMSNYHFLLLSAHMEKQITWYINRGYQQ